MEKLDPRKTPIATNISQTNSELELIDKSFERDQQAFLLGKKAMERVNVHKDYKEMMKQLPTLQRTERIGTISQDKPLHHMTAERAKLHEKKRQNVIENKYEVLFPEPNTVTLPIVQHNVQHDP